MKRNELVYFKSRVACISFGYKQITLTEFVFFKGDFFTENQEKVVGEMRGKVGGPYTADNRFLFKTPEKCLLVSVTI